MKFFTSIAILAASVANAAAEDCCTLGLTTTCPEGTVKMDTPMCCPSADDDPDVALILPCSPDGDVAVLDADPEGAEDLEDNADEIEDNAQDLDPEDLDPEGGGTDSAAPKESAITAAVGVALVGATLL